MHARPPPVIPKELPDVKEYLRLVGTMILTRW